MTTNEKPKKLIAFSLFKSELWPVTFLKDLALLLTKTGRKAIVTERHHLHSGYSYLIVATVFLFGIYLERFFPLQISTSPSWALGILGFLAAGAFNGWLEKRRQIKAGKYFNDDKWHYEVKFSWRDVRFGAYGGAIAGWFIGILF